MGKTSYKVTKRWQDKTYKNYAAHLRYDTDQHIIDFLEAHKGKNGATQIIREALEMYMKSGALD